MYTDPAQRQTGLHLVRQSTKVKCSGPCAGERHRNPETPTPKDAAPRAPPVPRAAPPVHRAALPLPAPRAPSCSRQRSSAAGHLQVVRGQGARFLSQTPPATLSILGVLHACLFLAKSSACSPFTAAMRLPRPWKCCGFGPAGRAPTPKPEATQVGAAASAAPSPSRSLGVSRGCPSPADREPPRGHSPTRRPPLQGGRLESGEGGDGNATRPPAKAGALRQDLPGARLQVGTTGLRALEASGTANRGASVGDGPHMHTNMSARANPNPPASAAAPRTTLHGNAAPNRPALL